MFAVLGGSVKSVDSLNPNRTSQLSFNFVSASSLEATSYAIPFKISYLDEQGNSLNTSQSLGVRVVNKGKINIQNIKIASAGGNSVIIAGQQLTIIARLENVGRGDADSVAAEVQCPFSSVKKAFVGQLKKDSNAPSVFDLTPPTAGNFVCNLNITYEDDTGVHKLAEKFDVTIVPANPPVLPILVFIIAVAIIFRKKILEIVKKRKLSPRHK